MGKRAGQLGLDRHGLHAPADFVGPPEWVPPQARPRTLRAAVRERWDTNPRNPGRVEAHVLCNGRRHTVVFDGMNLFVPNHPELAREKMLCEFGGRCRCLEVLDAWKRGDRNKLPDSLKNVYDTWRSYRASYRKIIRIRSSADTRRKNLHLPMLEFGRRVCTVNARHAVEACLEQCNYAFGLVKRPHVTWIAVGDFPPDVSCRKAKSQITLRVSVGYGWLKNVLKAGRAVIHGRLTLAALTQAEIDWWTQQGSAGLQRALKPWWMKAYGETPELTTSIPVLTAIRGLASTVGIYPWPARLYDGAGGSRWLELYKKPKGAKA